MQRKRILFLGYGDIAARAAEQLGEHELVAVARSPKQTAEPVSFVRGAADSEAVGERIANESWDAIVLTLTPSEYSDRAYELGYVQTLQRVLSFAANRPPGRLFFISSTSVYHQSQGQWVDEDSEVMPTSFSGQRLLEAEQLLPDSNIAYTVLRAAGIYGPGRNMLIKQVRAGKGGGEAYTNRVHAADLAGFLAYLISRSLAHQSLESLYLVCDGKPVTGREIRQWLAQQMGMDAQHLSPSQSERGGNKRCTNQRMLAAGYTMLYPDYQRGYREMLAAD